MTSQNHQLGWKALVGPSSCWFVNDVNAKAVNAVAIISGESSRIRRAWVRRPFSVVDVSGNPDTSHNEHTKDDETGSEGSRGGAASNSLQCEEHSRSEEDTAEGWEQTHCHIWDTGLDIILANLLEVEISVEAGEPPEQGDHKLRERRMDVHEEAALDILGGKTTEAVEGRG